MGATTLVFDGPLHDRLRQHLFPGDEMEAAAVLVCSRAPGPRLKLLVRETVLVPHEVCERARSGLTWPGEWIERAIDIGEPEGLVLILIHSHPGGFFDFSDLDDQSDQKTIPSLFAAYGTLHGSAIMTPNGAVRVRLYEGHGTPRVVELCSVVGDDLQFWWASGDVCPPTRPLAFTSDMTREFGRLSAAVIGVSGTGSVVAEQLARLGFGRIVLIDHDRIEGKNLNRILNSTLSDAEHRRLKVDMFSEAISTHRGANVAMPLDVSVATRAAVRAVSQCDMIFSCVDSLEARYIADLMSSAFLLPLFDMGVVIPVRKAGTETSIADVCGRVDFVYPGGSTLQDRGVYSPETLRAEYLRRAAPEAHLQELNDGYIPGLAEEAPAVITLNMRVASAAVNEMVARVFPFRLESNRLYARTRFSLAACEEEHFAEDEFVTAQNNMRARGDLEPLLGLPMLKAIQAVAEKA